MRTLIRRILFLLSRKYIILLFWLILFIFFSLKLTSAEDVFGNFVAFITSVTFIFILCIEDFDQNKYDMLFSLPMTRIEFAKSKLATLLIIYGLNTFFSLVIYMCLFVLGKTIFIPIQAIILEISLAFLISMIMGGMGIVSGNNLSIWHLIIIMPFARNIYIPESIVENKILISLLSLIFLAIGRFAFIITKENILRIYNEFEL